MYFIYFKHYLTYIKQFHMKYKLLINVCLAKLAYLIDAFNFGIKILDIP